MNRLVTVAMIAIALAIIPLAHASEQKPQCQYSDLYSGACEQDLVRFLQRLDLTAVQKSTIDQIYSALKQQRKTEFASYDDVRDDVLSLDPADPEYHDRVAQLAAKKAAHVEQCTLRSAAVQAEIYGLLTPVQKTAYAQLRNAWLQGRFEPQQPRQQTRKSRPAARNWASSSMTF